MLSCCFQIPHSTYDSTFNIHKYVSGFLKKSCKDLQTNKIEKQNHQRKMQVTQTILERLENMLKWYGHVVCMEDNSWEKNDLVIGTKTTSRSKVGKVS